jgi:hypothetical protein
MSIVKKLSVVAALSLSSVVVVAGCATDVEAEDDGVVDEAELTAAGKALIGSYKDDSGTFRGLILTSIKAGQANEFIADLHYTRVCVVAPCPSDERITGTFTAGTKTITFKSTTVSAYGTRFLGKYNYVVQGDKFSLNRKNFAQSLEKVGSYCSEASDCNVQGIMHPMCVGSFSCAEQNSCIFNCDVTPVDPCTGLELDDCTANPACKPKFGPSACSPKGICTADVAYKGCFEKPVGEGVVCLSSESCEANEHCSTEDGVCNPQGMLTVCAGTCVPNQDQ